MATLKIRDFRSEDLQAAAELLAASHARANSSASHTGSDGAASDRGARGAAAVGGDSDASSRPILGEQYFEARRCRGLVEQLVRSPRARSVVAEADGRICGFLAGERQLFAPEDFASIYAEPRSTNVPLHGHAVRRSEESGPDAATVYRAMYSTLAADWVADGFFTHNVAVRALEAEVVEAWAELGFGRKSVCAIRSIDALASESSRIERASENSRIEKESESAAKSPTTVTVEEIRGRDDDALELFHRRLMTFQTGPPMFWPYTGESDAKIRAVRRDALVSGQGLAYVARAADGEPLGSLLFVPAVFLSPLLVCDKMIYLWEGFVEQKFRAAGVGTKLLDHAFTALRERDLKWCALHYVSGNPRGGVFWPSKGFEPVEVVMHRHVDERVAWARGTNS